MSFTLLPPFNEMYNLVEEQRVCLLEENSLLKNRVSAQAEQIKLLRERVALLWQTIEAHTREAENTARTNDDVSR